MAIFLNNFLKLISVPSKAEQTAIAQVLQAANTEIQLLKTKKCGSRKRD